MARQIVAWFEPAHSARPEYVEARRHGARLVHRGNAEIDRFRLVIDLHQEWRSAAAAELAMAEAGRFHVSDVAFTLGPAKVCHRDSRKDHCGRSAAQLAGPAMAPSGIERVARQLVANGTAQTPASPRRH